jgi:hypothetical protein
MALHITARDPARQLADVKGFASQRPIDFYQVHLMTLVNMQQTITPYF